MADLEQEIFDTGEAPASPDLAPSSQPSPSPQPSSSDNRALSDAIDAIRGPVPNYGVQPQPTSPPAHPTPRSPDDQSVTAGQLKQLLEERSQRQRLEAQVREFQRQEAERQRQQTQPKTEDLLFQDPEGFRRQLIQEQQQQLTRHQVETDMRMAALKHGQVFNAAWQHFNERCEKGGDPVAWFRVMNSPSPGEEMVDWFRERWVLSQVGGDLNAFRNRILTEAVRDQAYLAWLDQVRAGGLPQQQQPQQAQPQLNEERRGADGRFVKQQPRQEVRLPTSLSRMNGASRGVSMTEQDDGSEEAIFDAGRPRRE